MIRARLQGLDIEHGNLLSTFVEESLDLDGVGRLLALTSNDEANALACQHFSDNFDSENVYQLQPSRPTGKEYTRNLTPLGRLLFAADATYGKIAEMIDRGAVIKRTSLTPQFTLVDYRNQYPSAESMLLMAIQGKRVIIATTDQPLQPRVGWALLTLTTVARATTSQLPTAGQARQNGGNPAAAADAADRDEAEPDTAQPAIAPRRALDLP